jgi:hypothetical protein
VKKRRTKLPLDDSRWVPIKEAIERRYKQTGSYTLTAADLNEALQKADKPDGLRSLERRAGARKLLSGATWRDDLHVSVARFPVEGKGDWPDWKEGAAVFPRQRDAPPIRGRWFFVWRPDFEELWPTDPPPTPSEELSPTEDRADDKLRRKPGPKANWRLPAAVELHRIRKDEGRTPTAPELCQFCDKTLNHYPDESEMRKLIRFLLAE